MGREKLSMLGSLYQLCSVQYSIGRKQIQPIISKAWTISSIVAIGSWIDWKNFQAYCQPSGGHQPQPNTSPINTYSNPKQIQSYHHRHIKIIHVLVWQTNYVLLWSQERQRMRFMIKLNQLFERLKCANCEIKCHSWHWQKEGLRPPTQNHNWQCWTCRKIPLQ